MKIFSLYKSVTFISILYSVFIFEVYLRSNTVNLYKDEIDLEDKVMSQLLENIRPNYLINNIKLSHAPHHDPT